MAVEMARTLRCLPKIDQSIGDVCCRVLRCVIVCVLECVAVCCVEVQHNIALTT